eukprot:evm.model.scf_582.10 EVM.evm.TU.scf_582.10   scf_582:55705-60927(+)
MQRVQSSDDVVFADMEAKNELERKVEKSYVDADEERLASAKGSLLQEVLDISSVLSDGAACLVDDSFFRCFTSATPDPWNWNFYLFPLWACGVVIRYLLLFPIRLLLLLGGFAVFLTSFFTVQLTMRDCALKRRLEKALCRFQFTMFVVSWTGVIKFHGPRPTAAPNRVWVANHTSMIDYIILSSYFPFAVIMQLHPGWVGWLQRRVLNCLGCLWFKRTEAKDRKLVMEKMRNHIRDPRSPLLIFPEGTCVNNEYSVMFKRGAFDIGATVCPIAIKYNKIFVDAFWNSRRQSFTQHLLKLMSSWAVVCDVYFLEPQTLRPGESWQSLASRVQGMIAKRAQLRVVSWDGYLKYYNLGEKHPQLIEKRRRVFANSIRRYLRSEEPSEESRTGEAEGIAQRKSRTEGAE